MHLGPAVKPSQLSIQRIEDSKRRRFLLACVLLSALVLLTIGLKDVDLRASAPIIFEQQEANSGARLPFLTLDQAFILVGFLLLSFILLLIVPSTSRKRGIAVLFALSTFAFILYLFSESSLRDNLPEGRVTPAVHTDELTPPAVDLTPPVALPPSAEFRPPQIPNIILYLISLSVTLSFIFVGWTFYRWRQSQLAPKTTQSLEEISEAARLALGDLAAGLDEKDAIINCYARMSDIVMHSRNIERGASRTATEFAARLESIGLPGSSVRRLTRLFESVRYGVHTPQQIEIDEAKDCLTDIARYCEEEA